MLYRMYIITSGLSEKYSTVGLSEDILHSVNSACSKAGGITGL